MAKSKGKTLWEMLRDYFSSAPVEFQFHNPLKARIGNAVTIDTYDLRDFNFFLQEVREYRRRLEGQEFLFTDYVLLARPLGGDDVVARIRLNPVADAARVAGLTHDALLLRLYEEMAYDKGLHDVLNDTTRKFQVLQDGVVQEEYYRLNDVTGPYQAEVHVIRDINKDGKIKSDEVRKIDIEYWDYWRETKDEAGQPLQQFLFVDLDTTNGWFQMWRGQAVDPHKVLVM